MKRSAILFFSLTIAACTSDAPKTAEDSAVQARAVAESTLAQARKDLTPKGESLSAAPTPAPAPSEKPAGEWEVTSAGIGDLRAGMGIDEAKLVMHDNLVVPDKLDECAFIKTKTGPKGVSFMLVGEHIVRVDVASGTVATVQGARIGDSEEKIKSLYPGQVAVQPHKYTDGHYLVVTPKDGSNNRIVFETDGKKVTRYRAGRNPEVQYVEGCA